MEDYFKSESKVVLLRDEKENKALSFSIDGLIQKCPFKQPLLSPGKLAGSVDVIEISCRNICPHFNVEDQFLSSNGNRIILTCGCKPVIYEIEK